MALIITGNGHCDTKKSLLYEFRFPADFTYLLFSIASSLVLYSVHDRRKQKLRIIIVRAK